MIAINLKLALKNFYDAGWNDEDRLKKAHAIIMNITPVADGYWNPQDIQTAIKKNPLN